MSNKTNRSTIMDECPEEFQQTLTDWIDEIEGAVNDILRHLDVKSIDDLDGIVTAKELADRLSRDLY